MGDLDYFKPKKKDEPIKVTPDVDTTRLINAQISATNDLKNVASEAINNPQLDKLVKLLSAQLLEKKGGNKRLIINRDKNKLISSIDVVGIQ